MGAYADKIKAENSRLSDAEIRHKKNQRSKSRRAERKARKNVPTVKRHWAEQWARLDARLGKNIGARRERERLAWEYLAELEAAAQKS